MKTFTSPDLLLASFFSGENPNSIVLITGPSGSGKTSLCARMVGLAKDAGLSVGGLLCPAVFEGGEKVSIDQLDITSGERRRLGVRAKDTDDRTVGCWQMDESVIAWGNEILAELKGKDVILIDELGPLEFEGGCGYQSAFPLLEEGNYRTAFVVVRSALLPLAKSRWPQAEIFPLEGMTI
jgi:energy-coupling factor transporter ATP-binding protein EcfA2